MDVSIVIINYNTYQYTCNCLASILEHTKAVQYEIILVDNASAECDPDLFLQKFPSIVLVKSKINLGFAGGNNEGIKKASGRNILLLNSDTVLIENSIRFIYEKCLPINNLGAATIKLIYPDGVIQPAAQKFYSLTAHVLFTTRLYKVFKKLYRSKKGQYNFNTDFEADWIWGTFFYFPAKNLRLMNGKLLDTYFMYSEDVEWCYTFKKNHLSNYYFGGSSVIHLGGQSSTKSYKNNLLIKNHLHFIKKHKGLAAYLAEKLLLSFDEMEYRWRFGSKKLNAK